MKINQKALFVGERLFFACCTFFLLDYVSSIHLNFKLPSIWKTVFLCDCVNIFKYASLCYKCNCQWENLNYNTIEWQNGKLVVYIVFDTWIHTIKVGRKSTFVLIHWYLMTRLFVNANIVRRTQKGRIERERERNRLGKFKQKFQYFVLICLTKWNSIRR